MRVSSSDRWPFLAFGLFLLCYPSAPAFSASRIRDIQAGGTGHEYVKCVQDLRSEGYSVSEARQACQTAPIAASQNSDIQAGGSIHEYVQCVQDLRSQGYSVSEARQACQTGSPLVTPLSEDTSSDAEP